jgi:hypothetical protein
MTYEKIYIRLMRVLLFLEKKNKTIRGALCTHVFSRID